MTSRNGEDALTAVKRLEDALAEQIGPRREAEARVRSARAEAEALLAAARAAAQEAATRRRDELLAAAAEDAAGIRAIADRTAADLRRRVDSGGGALTAELAALVLPEEVDACSSR